MSADILFGKKGMWSARTAGFNELIGRASLHCDEDDALIKEQLRFAEEVGCLSVDDIENPNQRTKLVRHILAASTELLEELCADARTHPKEIEGVHNLVSMCRECLEE